MTLTDGTHPHHPAPHVPAGAAGAFEPGDDAFVSRRMIIAFVSGALLVGLVAVLAISSLTTPGATPVTPPAGGGGRTNQTRPVHASGIALDDPTTCAPCHAAIHTEWLASQHRTSRTDDALRTLSIFIRSDPAAPECVACHRPSPILELPDETTDARTAVALPWPRDGRESDGVDCAACHVRNGRIVGAGRSSSRDTAGCAPLVQPRLATSAACANCHQSYLPGTKHSFDEWAADALTDQTCADCHMPWADGGPAGGAGRHRAHVMPGGHDAAFVRAAIGLSAQTDAPAQSVVVTLENRGTGHRLPTGYRIRRIRLVVTLHDATGTAIARRDYTMQKPSRWAGTDGLQIPHGASQEFTFAFADATTWGNASSAHIELRYMLWPRDEGELVGEATVAIPR
ncbi:MAG: hypothetical protein AB7K09_00450 [Planctomycetota bacterium]